MAKWYKRALKAVERVAKKDLSGMQSGKLPGGIPSPMGGMGMMGGAPQQSTTVDPNAADPNAQARSDAAQAMKRQAGGAQISFTGNNETPTSTA